MQTNHVGRPGPVDADKRIGQAIRAGRLKTGMTQAELAALVGVTYQQMHKYESGINRIPIVRAFRTCAILGIDASDLVKAVENETMPDDLMRRAPLPILEAYAVASDEARTTALQVLKLGRRAQA